MQYYKRIFFFKKLYKKCCHKLVPGPFYFHGIFCKKQSKEVSVLIWTNFHSFAYTYLIQVACLKNSGGYAEFFANTKGPGTSFQVAF